MPPSHLNISPSCLSCGSCWTYNFLVIFWLHLWLVIICLIKIFKDSMQIFWDLQASSLDLCPTDSRTLISAPSPQWYCSVLLETPFLHSELQMASNVDGRVHISFSFLRDQSLILFVFQLYNCFQWEVKFSSSSYIMAEITSALLFGNVNRKCVIGRGEARFLNEGSILEARTAT